MVQITVVAVKHLAAGSAEEIACRYRVSHQTRDLHVTPVSTHQLLLGGSEVIMPCIESDY